MANFTKILSSNNNSQDLTRAILKSVTVHPYCATVCVELPEVSKHKRLFYSTLSLLVFCFCFLPPIHLDLR